MFVKYIYVKPTKFMIMRGDINHYGGKGGRIYLLPSVMEDMRVMFLKPEMRWLYLCLMMFSLNITDNLIPYDTKFLSLRFGCKKEEIEDTILYLQKNKLLKIVEKTSPVLFERRKEFENLWAYFKRDYDKPGCYKMFCRSVRKPEDYRDIQIALANYFNSKFHIETRRLRRSHKYYLSIHQMREKGKYRSLGAKSTTHTPYFFFKHWRKLVKDKKTHKKKAIAAANRIQSLGWMKGRDFARKAIIEYRKSCLIKDNQKLPLDIL